jgi:hypothetical protein
LFRKRLFEIELNHGSVKDGSLPKGVHALHGFFKVWFEFEHDLINYLSLYFRHRQPVAAGGMSAPT